MADHHQGTSGHAEEFGNVILRTEADGSILRLQDVARIELGAQSYGFIGKYNTMEAIPIGVYLSPGANALETAEAVRTRMAELEQEFPVGVAYSIPYDTTTFVKISIEEVVKTLFEPASRFLSRLSVSPELAGSTDSVYRRSRVHRGNVCRDVPAWFFHQHTDHVRSGACHRHSGG